MFSFNARRSKASTWIVELGYAVKTMEIGENLKDLSLYLSNDPRLRSDRNWTEDRADVSYPEMERAVNRFFPVEHLQCARSRAQVILLAAVHSPYLADKHLRIR